MISWSEAIKLVKGTSRFEHSLLVSHLMAELARELKENTLEWKLVGLLHDLDYDETAENRTMHGVITAHRLKGRLPEECLYAIKAHDHRTGFKPKSKLDKALVIADSLAVLVEEVEKEGVTTETLKKELEKISLEKPWIKTNILKCEEIGLKLNQLLQTCINVVKTLRQNNRDLNER